MNNAERNSLLEKLNLFIKDDKNDFLKFGEEFIGEFIQQNDGFFALGSWSSCYAYFKNIRTKLEQNQTGNPRLLTKLNDSLQKIQDISMTESKEFESAESLMTFFHNLLVTAVIYSDSFPESKNS